MSRAMRIAAGTVSALGLIASAVVSSRAAGHFPPLVEMTTPDIPGVVAGGTKVQLVAWGIHGGEGPVAAPDGSLLFCEKDTSRILKIDLKGKLSVYLEHNNRTTGLALDAKGRLIGAGGVPPQLLILAPTRSVLLDTFEGQPFSRPNDMVIDKRGGLYFTDPLPLASRNSNTSPILLKMPPPPQGRKPAVFYLTPDGLLLIVSELVQRPNGIQLSPDDRVLYVANNHPAAEAVVAFDVRPDGRVENPRDFARLERGSVADGIATDAGGRLYVATSGGLHVFSPKGVQLGVIQFPTKPVNIAFAGPDKKTLYVVGPGAVYTIAMQAQGPLNRAK
jgi:gluconolactonase